ncbi:hypothetical protein [Bosea vaviloviae]|uniref:Uncharacterized protein n=1 Tax=Bosea vaviloviae TaxID=1526658 RepID=A0A0N1N2U4_9HYPH|nr:hypothetical protein [Bosea vaviloviae]KPH79341.1 hypothetical protein AE618_18750 [Bosea vaviloviae]
MNVVIPPRHPTDDMEAERLWQAWLDARKVAQASDRIEDGIAAGHAWAAFLALFARVEKPARGGGRP